MSRYAERGLKNTWRHGFLLLWYHRAWATEALAGMVVAIYTLRPVLPLSLVVVSCFMRGMSFPMLASSHKENAPEFIAVTETHRVLYTSMRVNFWLMRV
jgi:hypothetical protein